MHLPRDLSASAQRQLEDIGVEVRLNTMVKDIKENLVIVSAKEKPDVLETIQAASIVWSAGVGANPVTRTLGVDIDRAGRIKVNPDLSIPGYPEAFAIGDIAYILKKDGTPVPGVSPAAIQMGQYVAKTIECELADPHMKPRAARPVRLLGQGHDGDHRSLPRGGDDRLVQVQRFRGMADVAGRAHPVFGGLH